MQVFRGTLRVGGCQLSELDVEHVRPQAPVCKTLGNSKLQSRCGRADSRWSCPEERGCDTAWVADLDV